MTRLDEATDAIQAIRRLRRLERSVDPPARDEIADVREFLETATGPTVRPVDAARLLGISPPSLHRWLEKGEIATVLTPDGRREIPLQELLELLDEIEKLPEGEQRPVSRVIRERKRRAAAEIDLDRLLPRRRGRGHRTAELQSLAYHRLVAERLDDHLVDQARRRLRRWHRDRQIDPRWADAWEKILSRPLSRVAEA